MRLLSLILFGCVATTACTANQVRSGKAETLVNHERPLDESALRALFVDVVVSPLQPDGRFISHPPAEMFHNSGAYTRVVGKPRFGGTFSIRANSICVEGYGFPSSCRRVVPTASGTYTLVDVSDGSVTDVSIRPF